jgi:hypothetical protein
LFRSPFAYDFEIPFEPRPKAPSGYEVELASSADLGAFPAGSLIRLDSQFTPSKAKTPVMPDDAWLALDIVARGNHIVTKVNGETATELELSSPLHKRGHIALQIHEIRPRTVVQFRKIEIKELPSEEPGGDAR